jgi:hypothetical protein
MDVLGRQAARYATERPSLLILEAAFARVAGGGAWEDLKAAERLLSEADTLMTSAAHRPRVRLRLMRERSKVYRNLAARAEDSDTRQAYIDLAYLEIDRLWRLAVHANLAFWRRIARAQRTKMDRLLSQKSFGPHKQRIQTLPESS